MRSIPEYLSNPRSAKEPVSSRNLAASNFLHVMLYDPMHETSKLWASEYLPRTSSRTTLYAHKNQNRISPWSGSVDTARAEWVTIWSTWWCVVTQNTGYLCERCLDTWHEFTSKIVRRIAARCCLREGLVEATRLGPYIVWCWTQPEI